MQKWKKLILGGLAVFTLTACGANTDVEIESSPGEETPVDPDQDGVPNKDSESDGNDSSIIEESDGSEGTDSLHSSSEKSEE